MGGKAPAAGPATGNTGRYARALRLESIERWLQGLDPAALVCTGGPSSCPLAARLDALGPDVDAWVYPDPAGYGYALIREGDEGRAELRIPLPEGANALGLAIDDRCDRGAGGDEGEDENEDEDEGEGEGDNENEGEDEGESDEGVFLSAGEVLILLRRVRRDLAPRPIGGAGRRG